MSDKAEKTEDQEVDVTTADETSPEAAEETEGYEVVVSEDETPSSMPVASHLRQKEKWKAKVEKADSAKTATEAENELLRLQIEQLKGMPETPKVPLQHEYDSDEEYVKAMNDFVATNGKQAALAAVEEYKQTTASRGASLEREKQSEEALDQFYQRANKLGASDFEEAEIKVIETLGRDAALQVIQSFDHSEAVIYALGNNEGRLNQFADLLKKSPVKGIVELTKFAEKVSLKPKTTKAPAPDDTDIPAASSSKGYQVQLDKLRERSMKGEKGVMNEILALKSKAKAEGVALT
eukprot:g16850.t1